MKLLTTTIAAMLIATAVQAETRYATVTNVQPNYQNVTVNVPTTECQNVNVPTYGTVQRQGNAGEGALAGMIVGGLLGRGISGDSDGAAAGAVIGGILGANSSQNRTEQVVTGYTIQRQCSEVITQQTQREIRNYTITYRWNGVTAQSYTYNHYRVGDRIPVTVSINAQ